MSNKAKPFLLWLTAALFILNGMIMVLYCTASLIAFDKTNQFISQYPFLPGLFLYPAFSGSALTAVLTIRLVLGLVQIIAGILALDFKIWGLKLFRNLMLLAIILTLFNPLYPYPFILIFLIIYTSTLYYLYGGQLEGRYYSDFIPEKAKGILIFGCLEMVAGLLLLRAVFLSIPSSGMTMEFMTRFDFLFVLAIPKAAFIFFAYLTFMAGLLTMAYMPTGRMLNTFFCGLTFILTCSSVFLIRQPAEYSLKFSFLLFVICTLIGTGIIFLILTHPNIKLQFNNKEKKKFSQKCKRALSFTLSCLVILGLIQFTQQKYPHYFRTSYLKTHLPQSYIMENVDLNVSWENLGKRLTTFIEEHSANDGLQTSGQDDMLEKKMGVMATLSSEKQNRN